MATSRFEHPSASPVALLLPDLDCGGRFYWQEHWAATRIDCRTVDLGHARIPDRNACVSRLDHACRGIDAPLILVGHGLGALTIAAWAGLMSCESEVAVAGALLVTPSDPAADPRLQSFAPLPSSIFSFPALLVASDDERSFSLARRWGAGFARFPTDGPGWWPEGEELLDRFIDLVEPGHGPVFGGLDDFAILGGRADRGGAAPFLFRPA